MTPGEFIKKWRDSSNLRERQASQSHFNDLCALLGEPTPTDADPVGDHYCFERGAEKVGGGDGWADVWRRHCFGWEYKGKHKSLDAALRQLQAYALDLENPPYLVVSDMEQIIVHTNWTNTVSKKYPFILDDLHKPERLEDLRSVLRGSERLKPGIDRRDLTAAAARTFGALGQRLQDQGHAPREVAHFLNRMVFCMFAEDTDLLPKNLFTRTIKGIVDQPEAAEKQISDLFSKMSTKGNFFGPDAIRWFNGGLFDDVKVLPLQRNDLVSIATIAEEHNWSEIDPAIFGTLFEQALKATRERPALGAHYTDREKILKIVEPVIVRPLAAEWENIRREIAELAKAASQIEHQSTQLARQATSTTMLPQSETASGLLLDESPAHDTSGLRVLRKQLRALEAEAHAARAKAKALLGAYQKRLSSFRILDPACGSGNFLYVALHELRDLEQRAVLDCNRMEISAAPLMVSIDSVLGIEKDPYAAELARVTLWIGNLQWLIKRGYSEYLKEPLLSDLDQIENRDALLDEDGTETAWPPCDVIIGNPPFLGGSRLRSQLGTAETLQLWKTFQGRVSGSCDLYTYWFDKAHRMIVDGVAKRAGLICKNTFTQVSSRSVLQRLAESSRLFDVHTRVPWMQEGAEVEVHFICFGEWNSLCRLNGQTVERISWELETGKVSGNTLSPSSLPENAALAFTGVTRNGPFDLAGDLARRLLMQPVNVNGRPNSDVLRPYVNGNDLVKLRPRDKWLLDFGIGHTEEWAAEYEEPYRIARERVLPKRSKNSNKALRERWWEFERPRPPLRAGLADISRYCAISEKSEHFVWRFVDSRIIPDNRLIVCLRDDFTTFGILQSRLHEVWANKFGALLQDRPCYTPSTTFETFPFPEGLTPDIPASEYDSEPRAMLIAEAAADLDKKRENWVNPPDLVHRQPEVSGEYPLRVLAKDEESAVKLSKRTLGHLYKKKPEWLILAHRRLDEAVAKAYGWPADLSDAEILNRLFALNQARSVTK
ncbi:MAG: class I SAM-dependent DNA methyltransferase [Mesorhizobium sp.]|uniref:class I SAM-dependent DNA methyltransferase n=1 Tax=Mesorhizobium sp. TaxID=1871066 RepID=UPI000FE80DA8|nr:DNA methyltransferase [Mesorhizobium sp.]RWJ39803.1 MAG: class I SAM-dependent DNA methyltransferase [Mesorhizobium sp.]RWJ81344.1 MAG: class I SAM-dependent DNA methyltransferase [Mesorhizobium sp.]TIR08855.1 MAG: class I SAM-dependent DNA methyltransferase [Mesorhizobium sp.]